MSPDPNQNGRRGRTFLHLRSGHAGLGGVTPKPPEYLNQKEARLSWSGIFFLGQILPPEAAMMAASTSARTKFRLQ